MASNTFVSTDILISLLESILSGETNQYASFKDFCDNKIDNEGNFLFGAPGTPLRRGKKTLPSVIADFIR